MGGCLPCLPHNSGPTSQAPAAGVTASLVGRGADAKQDKGWIAESLLSHNVLRAKHGAPPLTWSADCAAKAQMAADECAAHNNLHHSHHTEFGHGQNAFGGTPVGHFGAKDAVEAWYAEVNNPGYTAWDSKNFTIPGTGHFTQLVWKECAEVGMACDASGKGYIVANYWPPGNVQGLFDKNVFKEGTPMHTRKVVRRKPYTKDMITALDAEVQSVLDSVPAENIVTTITEKLKDGWTVKLDYKPAPDGFLKFEYKKDGTIGSGSVGPF